MWKTSMYASRGINPRRGVGYSWTNLRVDPKSDIFGSGGYEDEYNTNTIINNKAKNTEVEEARALDGVGEGSLDTASMPQVEDVANANVEFNFRQFKPSSRDEGVKLELTAVDDGLSHGDMLISNDPRNTEYGQVSDALTNLVGKIYGDPNIKGDPNPDITYKRPNAGINPFATRPYLQSMIPPKKSQQSENEQGAGEMDLLDENTKYYFQSTNMDASDDKAVTFNKNTGLHRQHLRKTQSQLQKHLSDKINIDDMNNNALERTQTEAKHKGVLLSEKEHEEANEDIRTPLNTYTAQQTGVSSTSHKSAKKSKKSKVSKLNQALL